MSHLVYHNLPGLPGQSSPFDEAILKVCKSGTIRIVSPYIGVDYLQRIIKVSTTWRLISDIETWLSSLSIRARPKAWQFIRENLENIHHCPAVHAKTVIGQRLAMLGSANLTNAGILGRTEMSILIDDLKMVGELTVWFDALWLQTHPPIASEANAFIQWLDEEAKFSPTRREKFAVSVSGIKIRARLATLPISPVHEDKAETVHLEEVAQVLIIQEQNHYNSLSQALESAINNLAESGFSFGQIVENIRQVYPESTTREIYFALLQHCANHVRSVFSENTRNRLVLVDGRFIQSSSDLIPQALALFDSFLEYMVDRFEFGKVRDMPDESDLESLTGIPGHEQTILISALLDCGFLEIEDTAGRLPQYNLSEAFEWNGRYKLFSKAMHDWKTKMKGTFQLIEKLKRNNSRNLNNVEFPLVEMSVGVLSAERAVEPFFNGEKMSLSDFLRSEQEKTEIADRARKEQLAVNRQNRHDGIDKILAHLLQSLLSGKRLPSAKALLVELPAKLTVKPKWVQQVLHGEEADIPVVIVARGNTVSINPTFDWSDLVDFPLTQGVCKTFLEM